MNNVLKEHSEQLLKVIGETERYIEEIQEETPSAMVITITEQIDDYLLDIDEYATSIDYLLEDMEQTHEQWLDEQIKRLLVSVNYDQLLNDDTEITTVSDLITHELNETKYKDTKYKANKNDIRAWLKSMITLHHYMFERGNLKYSESFNPYIILDLDK